MRQIFKKGKRLLAGLLAMLIMYSGIAEPLVRTAAANPDPVKETEVIEESRLESIQDKQAYEVRLNTFDGQFVFEEMHLVSCADNGTLILSYEVLDTVTFSVQNSTGSLMEITAETSAGKTVELTKGANDFSFVMPAENVTVAVKEIETIEAVEENGKIPGDTAADMTEEAEEDGLVYPGFTPAINHIGDIVGVGYIGDALPGSLGRADTGLPALITPGVSHSYGSWVTCEFTVTTDTGSYLGFCAQPNYSTPSGYKTIAVLDNDYIKFLLLSYGYDSELYHAIGQYMYQAGNAYAYCHAMIGYIYMGSLQGLSGSEETGIVDMVTAITKPGGWVEEYKEILDKYTVYVAYGGNQQDIVWAESNPAPVTGYIELYKNSSDSTATHGNINYSLEEAVYQVFTESDCTAGSFVCNIITDANGYGISQALPLGTYYIKEYQASAGHQLDETIQAVTVTSSNTLISNPAVIGVTIYSEEPVILGRVEVYKYSDNYEMTKNNDCYSLIGAVYQVYTDADCNAGSFVSNIYIDTLSDDYTYGYGISDMELPLGQYYIKEIHASKGYKVDETIYPAAITADSALDSGKGVGISKYVEEESLNSPIDIVLYKQDADTKEPIIGAVFTVKYYNSQYTKDSLPSIAARTWVFKTNENGYIILDDIHKISGDDLYKNTNNQYCIPLGTITIQETHSPDNYIINDTVYLFNIETEGNPNGITVTAWNAPTISNIEKRGGVTVTKYDTGTKSTTAQGNATLEGTEFTVYSLNGEPVYVNGRYYSNGDAVTTITAGADAVASTSNDYLPYGDYRIVETKAASGMTLGSFTKNFSITTNGQMTKYNTFDTGSQNDVIRGDVQVIKQDLKLAEIMSSLLAQGNADLTGILFEIVNTSTNAVKVNDVFYNPGEVVAAITTRLSGNKIIAETSGGLLPYGTYTIQETASNSSYLLTDGTPRAFQILSDGYVETANVNGEELIFKNKVYSGGVKIQKADDEMKSAQGDGTLTGAKFAIINKSAAGVVVDGTFYEVGSIVKYITTNASGIAETSPDTLPYGTYMIYESDPSNGYLLNSTWSQTFTIRENGVIVDLTSNIVDEPVIRGGVRIQKVDEGLKTSAAQGDTTLEGARFAIVNISSASVFVDGAAYAPGEIVKYIITNAAGEAATAADTLPFGTYKIYEVDASAGYLINSEWIQIFTIRSDGVIENLTSPAVAEPVIRGGVSIQKVDKDLQKTTAQGDASLAGAKFAIVNRSASVVVVDGVTYFIGDVVKYIRTDAAGFARTNADALPYGTYEIYEVDPATGYLLNNFWTQTFTIRQNGLIVDLSSKTVEEPVIRGGVQITKFDLELDTGEAIGGANHTASEYGTALEGIVFDITNTSAAPVVVNDVTYEAGEVVASIATHWNGTLNAYTAESASDTLPYGTYTIKEVKTSTGYLLTDGDAKTFVIREEGKIVTVDTSNNGLIFKNQVIRGDFELVKIADTVSTRLSVAFKVTNLTTSETHVIVTDANGEFFSESDWNPHSDNTNGNDWLLDNYVDGVTILKTADFDIYAGIWFGVGEDGSIANVKDALGALPYGTYQITELRCEENLNHVLQSFTFKIYRNGRAVDLGTVTDDAVVTPEIGTTAADIKTEDGVGVVDTLTTIADTVYYNNLTIGKEYTISGILMNQEENVPLLVEGKEITAEKVFKAKAVSGYEELTFTFDSSALAGTSVVVFEDLYEDEILAATHSDITDEDQTIHYPGIHTNAADINTGSSTGTVSEETTIVDRVTYSNLIIGKKYTVSGKLIAQASGKALLIDDKEITAEKTFVAETVDGYVDLNFTFDSSALAGQTIVVFEDLYHEDIKVTTHSDITDKSQTIYYPEIGTTAKDIQTGDHVGMVAEEITIIDRVEYQNLIAGKEYMVSGKLMNQATGEALLIDGREITAEKTFIAETENGYMELSFTLNSSTLEGQSVVVFEDLYHEGIKITTHSDITDEGQTVNYPEIHTTAADIQTGDHVGTVAEETTIVDRVEYTNLIVGKEYTVSGKLMNQATGEALLVDGVEVTAEKAFIVEAADGYIELTFTFNSSAQAGQSVVVFEELYHEGVKVTIHSDITDEGQTVNYPEIHTNATDINTGDHTGTIAEETTIVDRVDYMNLFTGSEYTISGKLMNQTTGEALLINGKEVTAEKTFIAETEDGYVELTFTFNSSALAGQSVVVFEDIYYKGIKIAAHSNINDENQTVAFKASSSRTTTSMSIKTGDLIRPVLWVILSIISTRVLITIIQKKKSKSNNSN